MEIYLVGGAIRDELLGLPVTEKDWVVVGSTPKEMFARGFASVGKDFPVFLHPETHEEYALARTESKSGKGHRGSVVDANRTITLEQDLQRRDLTINAIARDANGKLIDPVNGIADLESRILQHVSPAFSDDPLRVLRVARFYARFHHLGFRVSELTMALMREMISSGQLGELTTERVFIELEKALGTTSPWKFFELLKDIDGLDSIGFEKIAIDLDQFKRNCELGTDPVIRFACLLCHSSESLIQQLSSHLKAPKRYAEAARLIATHYDTWRSIGQLEASNIIDFFYSIDAYRRPERLELLQASCSLLQRSEGISPEAQVGHWQKCFDITRKAPVDGIPKNLKGKEISDAIRSTRIQLVISTEFGTESSSSD